MPGYKDSITDNKPWCWMVDTSLSTTWYWGWDSGPWVWEAGAQPLSQAPVPLGNASDPHSACLGYLNLCLTLTSLCSCHWTRRRRTCLCHSFKNWPRASLKSHLGSRSPRFEVDSLTPVPAHPNPGLHFKKLNLGCRDSSVGRNTCQQARWPELDPRTKAFALIV